MAKRVVILDSSQLEQFDNCPQRWQYSSNEHLRRLNEDGTPKEFEESEAMAAGTYGHKLLEVYHKARANGHNMTTAIDMFMAVNPPENTPLKKELADTVRERTKLYCYTFIQNEIIPFSSEHVEVGFSVPLYEDNDKLYILEGRIDLMGTVSGVPCVVDHKYQLRRHELYLKSIQFRNYTLASNYTMLLVNYIRLAKNIDNYTIKRESVGFSALEMINWKNRLIGMYDKVYNSLESGQFDQRISSCPGKFGQECQFTPLCEEIDEKFREHKKKTLYTIGQPFRPW